MRGHQLRVAVVVLLPFIGLGCNRSLEVPEPPGAPGPGTVQGIVVYVQPGSEVERPAVGATIELLGTSVSTAIDEQNGHFTLGPITTRRGTVVIRFDEDEDGRPDYQQLLTLEEIRAGPGRDIVLGTLQLGGNATVRGAVALSDQLGATTGLGGSSVFVPEGPYLTFTGDDGTFRLDTLPEGRITMTFYRPGYEPGSAQVVLTPNQVFQHETVVLRRSTYTGLTKVIGSVSLQDATDASGVVVGVSGSGVTAVTNAAGAWELPNLSPGLYTFGFSKAGYESAVKYNILVQGELTVVPHVALVKGESMVPVLDAGVPPDAGNPGTGGGSGTAGGGAAGGGAAGGGAAGGGAAGGGAAGGGMAGGNNTAGGGTAGGATAGGATAGGGTAGGGFSGPVAVVSNVPPYALRNATVTLDSSASTGARPFTFHWSQDAGPTVAVPNNHSIGAASPMLTMPGTLSLLKMALTVTDLNGVDSAPADFLLRVVNGLPVAAISPKPPATVYAGQMITVGSTGTTDPNGAGLTGFQWSVLPSNSGVLVEPQGNGSTCRLTMPAMIPTNLAVQVQLRVTDGMGVPGSNVASESFVLSSMAAPTWTLDAGPLQTVNGGNLATLAALATAPQPGPTFSYQWSPGTIPDAGGYSFQVVDPNARVTQFATPTIQGPNVHLAFDVTATVTSGDLLPLQRTARTVVIVTDLTSPVPVATSVQPDLTGSPLGAWVEFSEDLSNGTPSITNNGQPAFAIGSRPWQLVTPRRWRIVFNQAAPEGSPIRLQTGPAHDVSPNNNQATNTQVLYTTHWLFPAPAVTAVDSASEPAPTLVPVARPGGEAAVYLVSQRNGNAVFQQLMNLDCTTACSVTEDATAPSIAVTTGKRGNQAPFVVAAGIPYVPLQAADFNGNPGIAVARRATGWSVIAPPPGSLFASPTTLFSAFIDSGSVKVAQYDAALNTWSAGVTVTTNAAEFPSTPGSNAGAWGVVLPNGAAALVAMTNTGLAHTFVNTSGTWNTTSSFFPSTAGDPYLQLRVLRQSDDPTETPLNALFATSQASGWKVSTFVGVTSNIANVAGIGAFDVFTEGAATWVAGIEAGQLVLRQRVGFTWPALPAPNPNNSWNASPACTAASPAIVRQGEHLAVAWAERCGANPWKTYVRWVR
ncbi:MAG: hypothetical protein JNK82_36910 [Myxococcaceae bacterium]|nr:hypothetical protein [Myxococcaceae bacterium]